MSEEETREEIEQIVNNNAETPVEEPIASVSEAPQEPVKEEPAEEVKE